MLVSAIIKVMFWKVLIFGSVFIFLGSAGVFIVYAQPAAPAGFQTTPTSACVIDLNWNQGSPGANYYNYQRSTDNWQQTWNSGRDPASGNFPAPVTGPRTYVDETEISPGTSYWYRLQSCDAIQCSPFIDANSGAPATTPIIQTPPAPVNLKAVGKRVGGVQDVDLTWEFTVAPSIYSRFYIYRSENGGPTSTVNSIPGTNPPFYRDLGRNLNSVYAYQVKTFENDLGCPLSAMVSSAPSNSAVVPIGPTNLDGSASGAANPIIDLTWEDNSNNEDGFEIWKSTDQIFPAGNRVVFPLESVDTTTFQDTFVNPNTTYYYQVRAAIVAASNYSYSVFSNIKTIATGLANPVLKGGIIYVADPAGGNVYLSWQGVVGASSYQLMRDVDSSFSNPVTVATISGSANPNYFDQNVALGRTYYYQLKAISGAQFSYSNTVSVNLDIYMILKGVGWASAGGPANNPIGIGWIKFNSSPENNSPASSNNYSVQVDRNGLLSGAGWASTRNIGGHNNGYGWASFNQSDLEDCPTTPNCKAEIDLSTGVVSGWARFLSPKIFSNQGAWNGWLRLRGNVGGAFIQNKQIAEQDREFNFWNSFLGKDIFNKLGSLINGVFAQSAPYGINYDSGTMNFSGAGWGGDVSGWLAVGPVNQSGCIRCNVRAELVGEEQLPPTPPTVSSVTVTPGPGTELWCAQSPYYSVGWTYEDANQDPQVRAEIKFVGPDIVTVVYESNDAIYIQNQNYLLSNPLSQLQPGQVYHAEVRAFDRKAWSNWASSPQFTTPSHYYPLVSFSWNPQAPQINSPVDFTDETQDRSTGSYPLNGWDWQFTNGTPQTSSDQNPLDVVFSVLSSTVGLTASDTSGAACSAEATVGGGSSGFRRKIIRER